MLALLRHWPGGPDATKEPVPEARERLQGGLVNRLRVAYAQASLDNVARSLTARLGTIEPGQLRDAVQSSDLAEERKQHLLERLAAIAPRGLRVSTTA